MPTETSKTRDKVMAHRARLRRQGLRPIQLWVPDVRSRAFAREAHRQFCLVARSGHEEADQKFVDVPRIKVGQRVGSLSGGDVTGLNRSILIFLGLAGASRR